MSHVPKLLHAISRVLSYPDESTVQSAELLYVLLTEEMPQAAAAAARFGQYVERTDMESIEEKYTQTFDFNPNGSLELGWHLFGEEYLRGMFLVRMREKLREYDLPESVELPDHVSHVLAVIAAMPDDDAARFVRACVQPAVEKLLRAMPEQTPYRDIVEILSSVLSYIWGQAERSDDERPPAGDPLRAFPAADVMPGCHTSCGASVEVVPLQMQIARKP